MGEIIGNDDRQFQAYLSEYQVMMDRIKFFISLQFMPLGPLVGFLAAEAAVAATFNILDRVLFAWVAAIATQIAALVYYFALHEVYNHVRYLETELKPKVAALLNVNTNKFWAWDGYLNQTGKAYDPKFADVVPAGVAIVALIGFLSSLSISQSCWLSKWNFLQLIITTGLSIRAILSAHEVRKVHYRFHAEKPPNAI